MSTKIYVLLAAVVAVTTTASVAQGSNQEIVRQLVLERFDTDQDGILDATERSNGRHTLRSLFRVAGDFPLEITTVLDSAIVSLLELFDHDHNQRLIGEEKVELRRAVYGLLFAPQRVSSRGATESVAKSRQRSRRRVQLWRALQINVGQIGNFGFYTGGSPSVSTGSDVTPILEFDSGAVGLPELDNADTTDGNHCPGINGIHFDEVHPDVEYDYPILYQSLTEAMLDDYRGRFVPDPISGQGNITRETEMFINFVRDYFDGDYPDNPNWWKNRRWWTEFALSPGLFRSTTSDRQRQFMLVLGQVMKSMVLKEEPDEALYRDVLKTVGNILREGNSELPPDF